MPSRYDTRESLASSSQLLPRYTRNTPASTRSTPPDPLRNRTRNKPRNRNPDPTPLHTRRYAIAVSYMSDCVPISYTIVIFGGWFAPPSHPTPCVDALFKPAPENQRVSRLFCLSDARYTDHYDATQIVNESRSNKPPTIHNVLQHNPLRSKTIRHATLSDGFPAITLSYALLRVRPPV